MSKERNYEIDLGEGAGLTEKDVTILLGKLTPDEIEQVGRCIDERGASHLTRRQQSA